MPLLLVEAQAVSEVQTTQTVETPKPRRKKLPIKRQKFVEALVGPANGNKTKAARMAGYAQPAMEGNRLMNFDSVAQAVEARLAKVTKAMDSDEILIGLTQIARGKRPSKIVKEDGFVASKDGSEAIPVEKVRREYDRKAGYEAMARVRGLMQEGQQKEPLLALASVPKPVLLDFARALLAVADQGKAIPTEATVVS